MNKQRSFWLALVTLAILVWHVEPGLAQTKIAGVDLQGTVIDVAEKPIAGATVWVYTAGPRVGRGYL